MMGVVLGGGGGGGGVGLLPHVFGVGQLASLAWDGDVLPLPEGEEGVRNGARIPERSEIWGKKT